MRTLLLSLLITSCATPKHYQVTTKLICPNGANYSFQDRLCHFKPKTLPIAMVLPGTTVKRFKAAKKHVRIDCKQVFKLVNQCMGAK